MKLLLYSDILNYFLSCNNLENFLIKEYYVSLLIDMHNQIIVCIHALRCG